MDATQVGALSTVLALGIGIAIPVISARIGSRSAFVNETNSLIAVLRIDRDEEKARGDHWQAEAEACYKQRLILMQDAAREAAREADANRVERMTNAETTAQAMKAVAESTPPSPPPSPPPSQDAP